MPSCFAFVIWGCCCSFSVQIAIARKTTPVDDPDALQPLSIVLAKAESLRSIDGEEELDQKETAWEKTKKAIGQARTALKGAVADMKKVKKKRAQQQEQERKAAQKRKEMEDKQNMKELEKRRKQLLTSGAAGAIFDLKDALCPSCPTFAEELDFAKASFSEPFIVTGCKSFKSLVAEVEEKDRETATPVRRGASL